jgi:hypothetical protein
MCEEWSNHCVACCVVVCVRSLQPALSEVCRRSEVGPIIALCRVLQLFVIAYCATVFVSLLLIRLILGFTIFAQNLCVRNVAYARVLPLRL